MSIETLVDRLEQVSACGQGKWKARCPAHQDRSPSLSVRQTGDGTILLHCFAGCDVSDVLAAVGMDIRDLFPQALAHHIAPRRAGLSAFDMAQVLRHELLIVELLAEDLANGREFPGFRARAQLAADRIHTALSLCDG